MCRSTVRAPTIIGRSDIAGKPTALILGGRLRNATITWCHRHTRDLTAICREADILIPCVGADTGRPYLITADMVKPGACVIDVGFRRVGPGKFVGDVDFEAVKEVAGWITLNPGGTGPMTVARADAKPDRRDPLSARIAARRILRLRRARHSRRIALRKVRRFPYICKLQ